MSFDEITRVARSLLTTSLSCPTGASSSDSDAGLAHSSRGLSQKLAIWSNFKAYLESQKRDYQAHTLAYSLLENTLGQPQPSLADQSGDQLLETIDDLSLELVAKKSDWLLDTLALDQMQINLMTAQLLYNTKADGGVWLEPQEHAYFEEALRRRDRLAGECLTIHAELERCHEVLGELEARAASERVANRELASAVVEARKQREAERDERDEMLLGTGSSPSPASSSSSSSSQRAQQLQAAQSSLALQRARSLIIRFVFQSLITESGVDWMADEKLAELVLSLEDGEPGVDEESDK